MPNPTGRSKLEPITIGRLVIDSDDMGRITPGPNPNVYILLSIRYKTHVCVHEKSIGRS